MRGSVGIRLILVASLRLRSKDKVKNHIRAPTRLVPGSAAHATHFARRRVPKEWIAAITPLTIGACAGTCGTAAFLKERVITRDIAADPLWMDHRDLALSNGLRAAWSHPLLSKNQQLLGTFAIYYAEPRTPSECDL
jgi:GAF domain-containing protein